MKNKEIALPWFPITPNYIDQYHESVLKYKNWKLAYINRGANNYCLTIVLKKKDML